MPADDDGHKTRLTSGSDGALGKPYVNDGRLQPGDLVGDNYEIISLIGVGGMGCVYKVRHCILQKIYAMKTMNSDQVSDMTWRRLQVEAQAIARMSHPNIVGIHNLGLHNGVPFYVMDYLEGTNLSDIIISKELDLDQALPIFLEICSGLGYAHKKGIVHRDIKPGNIVILDKPDVSGATVKIVDFGIAKLAGASDPDNQKLTTVGEVFGSPLYMSPEQCDGKKIDSRADIYSLGCTMFEVLTGQTPFRGSNQVMTMMLHREQQPPTLSKVTGIDFPDSIEHVIATMLAKAPMDRYQNLERVADDLQSIMEGEEIEVSPFVGSINRQGTFEGPDFEHVHIAKNARAKLSTFAQVGIILICGALLLALVGTVVILTKQKQEPKIVPGTAVAVEQAAKPAEENENATPDSVSAIQPASEKLEPGEQQFYSKLINNGKNIEFNFPPDQSIGRIGTSERFKTQKEARGTVQFKSTSKLYFYANEYLLSHPKLLSLFRHDDIYAFAFPTSLVGIVEINGALPYLVRLDSIRRLDLRTTKADDSIMPYLNQLPNLEMLNTSMSPVTGKALATYKGLPNLRWLYVSYIKQKENLIKALPRASQLEALHMESPETPITDEDANYISRTPRLQHLNLQASATSNRAFFTMGTMPNLDFIDVSGCNISKEMVDEVKQARKGKGRPIKILNANQIHRDAHAFGDESPEDWFK